MKWNGKIIKNRLSWPYFWLLISIIYALSINLLEFSVLPEAKMAGFIKVAFQWLIISCVSAGVLGVISANRIVFLILFPIITVLSTVEVYFLLTLGAGITATTLEIALVNNALMWESVFDGLLVFFILLSLLIGIGAGLIRWKYVEFKGLLSKITLVISFLLFILPFCNTRIYSASSNRMPLALYDSTKNYLENRKIILEKRDTYEGVRVESEDSISPNIILVIGESLRADHLPMNGYERNTMPLLQEMPNLISFPNLRSTGSHTYISLPYLMTRADSLNEETGYEEQSFITLFKNAGYRTSWLANQDISSSYSYFAHEVDTLIHINSMRSLYSYDLWLDDDVLVPFREWYGLNEKKSLTIIHSIGSHWWYKSHYKESDARFLPEMDSKEISTLNPEQIINSYDNTIIATDRFLFDLINQIKDDNSLLIFVSDHGEGLGEEGQWLHGSDLDVLHQPAFLIWYSDLYSRLFPRKIEGLKENSKNQGSTDDLFYTIIDGAGLKTAVLIPERSFFHETKNRMD